MKMNLDHDDNDDDITSSLTVLIFSSILPPSETSDGSNWNKNKIIVASANAQKGKLGRRRVDVTRAAVVGLPVIVVGEIQSPTFRSEI